MINKKDGERMKSIGKATDNASTSTDTTIRIRATRGCKMVRNKLLRRTAKIFGSFNSIRKACA
jgi:hypothetical protein